MLGRPSAVLLCRLCRHGATCHRKLPLVRAMSSQFGRNLPVNLAPTFPTLKNPWVEDMLSSDLQQQPDKKPPLEFQVPRSVPVDFESSADDFIAYVTPLLARETVPPLPRHASYPTPSGWSPPSPAALAGETGRPYVVLRTRNHSLPVYYSETERRKTENVPGRRRITKVLKVQGDVAALAADLRRLLEPDNDGPLFMQVDEVSGRIRIVGQHEERVAKFLIECGF